MPIAQRITQKQVKAGLKGDWTWDRTCPSYEYRRCDVLAGSMNFRQRRHTGIKGSMQFIVTFYTGNPKARWAGDTFDTLKEAVAYGNEHRQEAVDATAAELGNDFMDRE